MDGDLLRGHAERDHVALHCRRDRKQPGRVQPGMQHLLARLRVAAPMVDIRPARLDRIRDGQPPREFARCGAVGIEEFGIDQVERLREVQSLDQRPDRADHQLWLKMVAKPGQVQEVRAIHVQPAPGFAKGQLCQGAIARMAGERPGGESLRADHGDFDIVAACERCGLALDEDAEIGARCIRKQRGKGQDAHHRATLIVRGLTFLPLPARVDR